MTAIKNKTITLNRIQSHVKVFRRFSRLRFAEADPVELFPELVPFVVVPVLLFKLVLLVLIGIAVGIDVKSSTLVTQEGSFGSHWE